MNVTDSVGAVFSKLTVLRVVSTGKHPMILVACECGTNKVVQWGHVKAGRSRSCGCIRRDALTEKNYTHRMTGTREYNSWVSAKWRCTCTSPTMRKYYLDKGIKVCDEWLNDFAAFYNHMGPRPPGTTLDRIDGNRGYEPGNCRWATPHVQRVNRSKPPKQRRLP